METKVIFRNKVFENLYLFTKTINNKNILALFFKKHTSLYKKLNKKFFIITLLLCFI